MLVNDGNFFIGKLCKANSNSNAFCGSLFPPLEDDGPPQKDIACTVDRDEATQMFVDF